MIGDRRLRAAFADQARACRSLESPFMGQLCEVLSENLRRGTPLTDRLFDWEGELGPRHASVPLRVCGALHALRLRGNEQLAAVYPPAKVKGSELWSAVQSVLSEEAAFIDAFIDSAPQTNEVRRSGTILPAAQVVANRFGLPFRMMELGASGGLNLIWDRVRVETNQGAFGAAEPVLTLSPYWTGSLPTDATVTVVSKAAVDLNPLDPRDPDDALRLKAYLWADQPERLELTRAAIAATEVPVEKGDAIDWLARRIKIGADGHVRFIYTTVAWQYFPPEAQARGTALIEAEGERATDTSPIAWFGMENDGTQPGAVLTLRLWPGDEKISLGRADFHGRWIDWRYSG